LNDITGKMRKAFRDAEGGLFGDVEKADVGDQVVVLMKQGYTLMSWADAFFPDSATPAHVSRATADVILEGRGAHYTAPIGSGSLKVKIAKKLKRENQLDVDPQRNILITPGSDSGLFFAMIPFVQDGDDVMIPDPSYPNNAQNTHILGGNVIDVPLDPAKGWALDVRAFEERITPATKMVVLTNPNNPTANVFRREALEALAEFIIRHDLVCVVDQAFEDIIFDDIEMVTIASLPGMWERTISVFSFSKGMGLSGYRVGYLVTNDVIMDKLYGTAVSVIGATNTAAQAGAEAALDDPSFLNDYRRIQKYRRDFCYKALHDIPGVRMYKSESGILSWLDVSALGAESDVVKHLRDHAKVLVNGGSVYGPSGRGHIRVVHGVLSSDEKFEDAVCRMRKALLDLSKNRKREASC
jgi:aspartate/methionine/tyrosine aminotransferase